MLKSQLRKKRITQYYLKRHLKVRNIGIIQAVRGDFKGENGIFDLDIAQTIVLY